MKGNFSDPFIHPFSSFSAVPDPGPRRRSPRIGESARQETRRGPVVERASGVEAAAGMSDGNVGGAHSCPHHRRGWDWNSRLHQQSEPLRQPCPRTTGGIAGTFIHGSVAPSCQEHMRPLRHDQQLSDSRTYLMSFLYPKQYKRPQVNLCAHKN